MFLFLHFPSHRNSSSCSVSSISSSPPCIPPSLVFLGELWQSEPSPLFWPNGFDPPASRPSTCGSLQPYLMAFHSSDLCRLVGLERTMTFPSVGLQVFTTHASLFMTFCFFGPAAVSLFCKFPVMRRHLGPTRTMTVRHQSEFPGLIRLWEIGLLPVHFSGFGIMCMFYLY